MKVWSVFMMPTCINMASISGVIATEFSLNRSYSPTKMFSKSGPVTRLLFIEFPLNVDAMFRTRRAFRGMFGLVTGWCGRYQTRSGVVSLKVTDLTYRFSMSLSIVFCNISFSYSPFSLSRAFWALIRGSCSQEKFFHSREHRFHIFFLYVALCFSVFLLPFFRSWRRKLLLHFMFQMCPVFKNWSWIQPKGFYHHLLKKSFPCQKPQNYLTEI